MDAHFDILLVDDDIDDLDLTSAIIKSLWPLMIVHTLTNGLEALAYLENLPNDSLPDLLMVDFNMALITGAEVLEQLGRKERYRHLFKIVLSTGGNHMEIKRCMKAGATGYFIKGCSLEENILIVNNILLLCGKRHEQYKPRLAGVCRQTGQ